LFLVGRWWTQALQIHHERHRDATSILDAVFEELQAGALLCAITPLPKSLLPALTEMQDSILPSYCQAGRQPWKSAELVDMKIASGPAKKRLWKPVDRPKAFF
jgi:hypothetical protein